MIDKLEFRAPRKEQQMIAVLCIDCGKAFTCIEDSDAHKQGLCNICWGSMVVRSNTGGVDS